MGEHGDSTGIGAGTDGTRTGHHSSEGKITLQHVATFCASVAACALVSVFFSRDLLLVAVGHVRNAACGRTHKALSSRISAPAIGRGDSSGATVYVRFVAHPPSVWPWLP